jgi:hypothetical protein
MQARPVRGSFQLTPAQYTCVDRQCAVEPLVHAFVSFDARAFDACAALFADRFLPYVDSLLGDQLDRLLHSALCIRHSHDGRV